MCAPFRHTERLLMLMLGSITTLGSFLKSCLFRSDAANLLDIVALLQTLIIKAPCALYTFHFIGIAHIPNIAL